jgi:hypothetical protein
MKIKFSRQAVENSRLRVISNLMKIRSAGTEFIHMDGRTDKHDEVNSLFYQFFRLRLTYPSILIANILLAFFKATQNFPITYKNL